MTVLDRALARLRIASAEAGNEAQFEQLKQYLTSAQPQASYREFAEALPFVTFVAVDNHLAVRSVQLTGLEHDDPADRIILATTISLRARLVTKDRRLRGYSDVETVW